MSKLNTNIKTVFSTIYDTEPIIVAKIEGTTAPYSCSWEVTSSVGDPTQHKILAVLKDVHPKYTNIQTSSIVLADNEDAFRTDRYDAYETRETVLKLTVTDAYKEYNTFIYTASVEGYSTITPNKYVNDDAKYCASCLSQRAVVNDSLFDFLDDPTKQPTYNEVYNRYTQDYPNIPSEEDIEILNNIILSNPYGMDATELEVITVDNFYSECANLYRRLRDLLWKNNYEEVYNREDAIYVQHQKILENKSYTDYQTYINDIKSTLLKLNKYDSFNKSNFKNFNILLGAELHDYENLPTASAIKSAIGNVKIKFIQTLPLPSDGQLPLSGNPGDVIVFYENTPSYEIMEKWAWHPNKEGPDVGGWSDTLGDMIWELFEAREILRIAWLNALNDLQLASRAFSQASITAAMHRLR